MTIHQLADELIKLRNDCCAAGARNTLSQAERHALDQQIRQVRLLAAAEDTTYVGLRQLDSPDYPMLRGADAYRKSQPTIANLCRREFHLWTAECNLMADAIDRKDMERYLRRARTNTGRRRRRKWSDPCLNQDRPLSELAGRLKLSANLGARTRDVKKFVKKQVRLIDILLIVVRDCLPVGQAQFRVAHSVGVGLCARKR